jgi:serine/threonine-protein kinase
MSWHGAVAYTRWAAARWSLPYRLPSELEREKAVVGADGRRYPWGDAFDATWACMANSHHGDASRVDVDAFPLDESPYGLRGGAGNTRDFCIDLWTFRGPALVGRRLVVRPPEEGREDYRSVRGGAWAAVASECRPAARFASRPAERWSTTGLRLARSFP